MLRVAEIFGPTIQGEGALIGRPTVFVRLGGCDYRCSWCDSMHAVDARYRPQWEKLEELEILGRIQALAPAPMLVTLSGGNPALQDLEDLIDAGRELGYSFALETQGSYPREYFAKLDHLVLSPKPPSSRQEMTPQHAEALRSCVKLGPKPGRTVLKFVVFDEIDFAWARGVASAFPELPVFLQPGNALLDADANPRGPMLEKLELLAQWVIRDRWNAAAVLPQLHALLWGNRKGV